MLLRKQDGIFSSLDFKWFTFMYSLPVHKCARCEKTKVQGTAVALSQIDSGRESGSFVVIIIVVVVVVVDALLPAARACAVMSYIRPSLRVFVNRRRERERRGGGGEARDEEQSERRTEGRTKRSARHLFRTGFRTDRGPFPRLPCVHLLRNR